VNSLSTVAYEGRLTGMKYSSFSNFMILSSTSFFVDLSSTIFFLFEEGVSGVTVTVELKMGQTCGHQVLAESEFDLLTVQKC